jgi:glutamate racemase
MTTTTSNDPRPIGVFDSGIGGLTVVRQIMALLPHESIIYFGDTARIPYGTKSEETVRRFALEDSFFLLEKKVKLIVVACNSASAVAVDLLKRVLPVTVIGMIQPGAEAAIKYTRNKKIGVIGTAATIRSNAYQEEINALQSDMQVFSQSCPLFVPLVEEGLMQDEATYLIARRYLQPLIGNKVDALILGCTHYPLLKSTLRRVVRDYADRGTMRLIDSGVEAARKVNEILQKENKLSLTDHHANHLFYLSDFPYKFQEIGERFLERALPHVATVNFEKFLFEKGQAFWKKFEPLIKHPTKSGTG